MEDPVVLLERNLYVLCLGKVNQNPQSNTAWEQQLGWFKSSSEYRTLDTIYGEPMEFEWNIFPGFTTLQFCNKVQEFLSKMSEKPEKIQDVSSSCRCLMTSYGELKTLKRNVLLIPHLCLYLQKDFQHHIGHSSDLDQKQSGLLLATKDHKENGTKSLN